MKTRARVFIIVFLSLFAYEQASASAMLPYDLSLVPVTYYRNPGSNPVGKNTDPVPYIKNMKLGKGVEQWMIECATGTNHAWESRRGYIAKKDNKNVPQDGKHFFWLYAMAYDGKSKKKGKLLWNVIPKFGIVRPALFWQRDFDGIRVYLICDNQCYNWSFYCELAPEPVPEIEVSIPVGVPTVLPEVPAASAEKDEEESYFAWLDNIYPDWDSWAGSGVTIGLNNDDFGYYFTGFISFFPHIYLTEEGEVYFGPSYQHTSWGGYVDEVDYDGYFNFPGVDARYKLAQKEYQLKMYYGEKYGNVYGKDFPYFASTQAIILALEGAYLWWTDENQQEVGFRVELDLGGSKDSFWEGNRIPSSKDPRDSETMFYARYKYTWHPSEDDLIPYPKTAQISGAYIASDGSFSLGVEGGIKLADETIEPATRLGHNFKSGKLGLTGSVGIHVSDLTKELWDLITSDPVEADEESL